MPKPLVLVVALALILTACTGGAGADTTTTSSSTTTTTRATTTTTRATTTTADARPTSPLNGLPVDDEQALARRVLAVKIDNHPNARPQSGIQQADGVMEVRVEGGLTRFIALFHHSDSDYVGPIRSARPTDAKLVAPLGATLVISGGQEWVRAGIAALGVPYVSDTRPGMFRISGRSAPHNLYGATSELRVVADERDLPNDPPGAPIWEFGELPEGEPASEVRIVFSEGFAANWSWDGQRYLRSLGGAPSEWRSEDGTTGQIAADTLVVLEGTFYTASPPSGWTGSAVPATESVGSGRAVVIAGGEAVEGRWERESHTEPFTLTTSDGDPLPVPPGIPWVSMLPNVGAVEWTS